MQSIESARDWLARIGRLLGAKPSPADGPDGARDNRWWRGRRRLTVTAGLAAAVLAVVGVVLASAGGSSDQQAGQQPGTGSQAAAGAGVQAAGAQPSAATQPAVQPVRVPSAELAKLPRATTFATISSPPLDASPFTISSGTVLHPLTPQILYAGPGKRPIAVLPVTELGGPTWVPMVQTSGGWDQVLLPSRPNRATGWIYAGGNTDSRFEVRSSAYVIRIQVAARKLTVDDGSQQLGTWTVAVGTPRTPTPTGRTFLLALLAPPHPTYSPLILPLGFHSNVFSSFGGGPGTVGLHGWPDASVFGHAVSNGCVRVPADALHVLSGIPLGSLVLITR